MIFSAETYALIFAGLTAFAILLYAILDGYDLGVGISLPMNNEAHRDKAIASIGPFWDANETWLVLAVGLLLVAFPAAHSAILKAMYLPATALLIGLILRGVAFDFRAKAKTYQKRRWDRVFKIGSYVATFSQGFMLGLYVMGLEYTFASFVFSSFSGICVTFAYMMIGNAWLIMKTTGDLQLHAIKKCKQAGVFTFFGILSVCVVNPIINANAYAIWTKEPLVYLYAVIPLVCFAMFGIGYQVLKRLPLNNHSPTDDSKGTQVSNKQHQGDWLPFVMVCLIFVSCFAGLAVSFYPYVVPNALTIYEAASAPESLQIIFFGAVFVIPIITAYTAVAYYAFRGKAEDLRYY